MFIIALSLYVAHSGDCSVGQIIVLQFFLDDKYNAWQVKISDIKIVMATPINVWLKLILFQLQTLTNVHYALHVSTEFHIQ